MPHSRTVYRGLAVALLWLCCAAAHSDGIAHFVFLDRERVRISEPSFLENRAVAGAQIKYTWRELEPQKDAYDFTPIRKDLAFLLSRGKRLFIQLQDVSFDPTVVLVPKYLLEDAAYHGGAAKQYDIKADDEAHAVVEGWVARRWDPAVRARFHKLLFALGKAFDGKIEGINLAETAVSFGESGKLFPLGFSFDGYRDAVVENMAALKKAFPKSVTLQYANFMPGEWLPDKDMSYLRTVYRRAREMGVGVGGPDLLPFRRGQLNHSYPLIRASSGIVPTGIAVQSGNYNARDPKTGKQPTIAELTKFAVEQLKVKYIFWCTEEPFYSRQVLPFLNGAQ